MLSRKLVVVGLVGILSLVATVATAEDAAAPGAINIAVDDVSFADPTRPFDQENLQLNFGAVDSPRFANFAPSGHVRDEPEYRRYEVAVVARTPGDLDVAFAQRGGVAYNDQGDIERQSRGSELRLGRGLRRDSESFGTPTWYVFAASDDEALVWRPGARNDFGGAGNGFSLRDRVEIGDVQAGITYEVRGWQASLAYVEREVSARSGARTVSQDESFTGLTVTMRH